jgi:hypothetical protein
MAIPVLGNGVLPPLAVAVAAPRRYVLLRVHRASRARGTQVVLTWVDTDDTKTMKQQHRHDTEGR